MPFAASDLPQNRRVSTFWPEEATANLSDDAGAAASYDRRHKDAAAVKIAERH